MTNKRIVSIIGLLFLNLLPVRGAYDDYRNHIVRYSIEKTWDDAQAYCVSLGSELVRIDGSQDNVAIMSKIPDSSTDYHFTGVKCLAANDWSYNSNSYVKSLDPGRNSFWANDEPNSNCGD
jgi:hypothetical protein